MNKTENMLIAGTITGLGLAIFLIFGNMGEGGGQVDTVVPPMVVTVLQESPMVANSESGLQDQLQLMQAREVEYQQQIELANQIIQEMQQPAAVSFNSDEEYAEADDDDDHDDDHSHDRADKNDDYDDEEEDDE